MGWKSARRRTHPPLAVGGYTASRSPDEAGPLGHALGAWLPLPGNTPFEMLRVYRFLRDNIPDVSDAIWTWKRLCHPGYDVEL